MNGLESHRRALERDRHQPQARPRLRLRPRLRETSFTGFERAVDASGLDLPAFVFQGGASGVTHSEATEEEERDGEVSKCLRGETGYAGGRSLARGRVRRVWNAELFLRRILGDLDVHGVG